MVSGQIPGLARNDGNGLKKLPVEEAVGTVLAHDITEIRPGEFKGRAFRKGHIVMEEDVCHLQRLGKEHLFVLDIAEDEMHEDDAAYAFAKTLMGKGVGISGEPKEGKINIVAETDGLLTINKDALLAFNMLDDVMCATLHGNVVVKKGQTVAGTKAIPLLVKKGVIHAAVRIGEKAGHVIEVREIRKPKAGVVITGNEIYNGRIKDGFLPMVKKKIEQFGGEFVGVHYAPDDADFIAQKLFSLLYDGADLLITTGGMSVDPDDVTPLAVRKLPVTETFYGTAVLPGAMFLIGYVDGAKMALHSKNGGSHNNIPIMCLPACGMYSKTTVFDLILPRVLAGQFIGRKELAEMGHGGLCMNCKECTFPVCPFGKY
ncbi:MAG: molybdopterin-binding protein [Nitrospirae bacterium]|nr:molybdopterin-binding protein [Nitrospirota bacterium]